MNVRPDNRDLTPADQRSPAAGPSPFDVPLPEIEGGLYRLFMQQETFTEEERAAWDEYEERREQAEQRRDRIGLVDLGEVMENGVTEPEMLVEDLLVAGEHHYVYGQKESAKTWIVLHAARRLIDDGRTVVWADLEMGSKNIADRLAALGADPAVVSDRFTYLEFPALDLGSEANVLWETLLRIEEPALVVFDAQTEFLAVAGLNENVGTDIEKWAQPYVTPARRVGAATVILDHLPHGGADRPVASRQKGASAKVELKVTRDGPFSRDDVGQVTIERTKNTVSAAIPEAQSFRIGGTPFTFEPVDPTVIDPKHMVRAGREAKVREAIVEVLREQGDELTQRNLAQLVKAKVGSGGVAEKRFNEIAAEMAESSLDPVKVRQGPNRALLYSLG